jgi:carbonic anhydrase
VRPARDVPIGPAGGTPVTISRVSLADDLLARNRAYAEQSFGGPRPLRPARALAVVACMDSRMDMFELLGLENGDAHVLRNAGGVVTDDVVRSLTISQRLLGTTGVVLVHHTDCGMQKLHDDEFGDHLEAATGTRPAFAIESFADPYDDVRRSIARLHASPFLATKDEIVGFVYDVDTGLLHLVDPA